MDDLSGESDHNVCRKIDNSNKCSEKCDDKVESSLYIFIPGVLCTIVKNPVIMAITISIMNRTMGSSI